MRATIVHAILAFACVAALATGGLELRPSLSGTLPIPAQPAPRPALRFDSEPAPPLDSLLRAAAAKAPFRASRTPASVPYDPARASQPAAPAAPPMPKPALTLSGLVWGGRTPAAVIEGIPGTDGSRVLRAGETVNGIRVRRIRRDGVVLSGLDTTWTLTVRVPWK
ncbi:MAG TPA: hypothetical protein VFW66_10570 [Gemmatimonadales bacterium]|nr:hypothetical protein [Gemmatimonadales bacterium]